MTQLELLPANILRDLKQSVDSNISPEQTSKTMATKFGKKFTIDFIIFHVSSYLGKIWDSEKCKYIDAKSSTIDQPHKDDTSVEEPIDDNTDKSESDSDEKSKCNMEENLEENSEVPIQNNRPDEILDYLKSISKNIGSLDGSIKHLNKRIDKIENLINEIRQDNPYKKSQKFADELIDIYAHENSKKSVNINPYINEKVKEMIKRKYNISSNNSLAINTALLRALYKSGLEQMPDKTECETNSSSKKKEL